MSFPVLVQKENDYYTATLVGTPDLRITASTREGVLAEMKNALLQRLSRGDLVFLDIPEPQGIMALAGVFRDDPTLNEICAEIYRERDAEPKE